MNYMLMTTRSGIRFMSSIQSPTSMTGLMEDLELGTLFSPLVTLVITACAELR